MASETHHELRAGDPAPDIQAEDDQGKPFRLADLKDKNVVVFFYPKANTPG